MAMIERGINRSVLKVRAITEAEGIHPEDNAFTTELMRMRYEED
jgi:hypothetical protein